MIQIAMMMMQKKNKTSIDLAPIKPSWAIQNAYRIKLMKLTKEMTKDLSAYTLKLYDNESEIIENVLTDSNIVSNMLFKFTDRWRKWNKLFIKFANAYTIDYINDIDKNVQSQLTKSLEPMRDFLHIKFDERSKKLLTIKQAAIGENVDLIKNVPVKLKEQITYNVTEAVSRGRDLKYLKTELTKLNIFTENRVKTITRDQVNKATSVISHARQVELGITKQKWAHTPIGKTYRKSHVAANGKIYKIDKGCEIDGEFIFPAQLYNCHCLSRPLLEFD